MNGIDPRISVLVGDARTRLTFLPDNSVHCVVTSPPYWQLRNYGISGQIGLENTIDHYLNEIVSVFREVRRVLRPDGTCFVNIGDTYAGGGNGGGGSFAKDGIREPLPGTDKNVAARSGARGVSGGIKTKELCGLPWRVAFALQADGWYLRCDIIWNKTNAMPESCKDRPTKSHEYIFMLTKSPNYFYDAEAIKEPVTGNSHARGNGVNPKAKVPSGWDTNKGTSHHEHIGRYKRPGKNSRIHVDRDPAHIAKGPKSRQNESFSAAVVGLVATKNKRSVWTFATAPFRGAHFATFPAKLVEPCILAGTSTHGCCNHCGAPFKRITEKGQPDLEWQRKCGGDKNGEYHGTATKDFDAAKAQDASATKARILAGMAEMKTIRWDATCKCENPTPVPCTVMDPFGGSGTTGMVAKQHGRNAILIELNPDYIPLIEKRCGIEKEAQVA